MLTLGFLIFLIIVLVVAGIGCIIVRQIPGLPPWMMQIVTLLICLVALLAIVDRMVPMGLLR